MLKKIIRLSAIWVVKILFAPRHFKVNFFKSLWYSIIGGFTSDQVYLYKLNMKNRHEYLSEFDWYKSRYINEPYSFVLNNKIVCSDLLKKYVDVPEIFAIKQKGMITSLDNRVNSYSEVMEEIKSRKEVFLKPNSEGKGNGILKIGYYNDAFYVDEVKINENDLNDLLIKRDNYHVCNSIRQSKYLNKIYDKTSNTIRIITLRSSDTNEFIIYSAVQRIGTSETIPVDNGSRGGLVAKIDIETGKLSSARCLQHDVNFSNHPDSNGKIEGIVIPNWNNIKEKILYAANKFPYLYFIAWDILPTDDSFFVIEANASSGINILQLWEGERQKGLGKFYKKYNIIKK